MKKFLLVFFLFLFSCSVWAVVERGEMKIYAVTTEGKGLSANLVLEIVPGSGKIWSSITPLVGTTTQSAERTAIDVAKKHVIEAGNYDYKISIQSEAAVVDGPSAGAALTLLTISMLKDKALPGNVTMTGTITDEGFVGQVGGVYEKVKAAAEEGIKLFIVPKGEAKQIIKTDEGGVKSINLLQYGPDELGLKVVEVGKIDEAIEYAFAEIADIEVKVEEHDLPEFVPQPIQFDPSLNPMKALSKEHLDETENVLKNAKNTLAGTLIDDTGLLSDLLITLNKAEQDLEKAKLLYDQNYLYSSANFAFLARVSGLLINDIADNPKLLTNNSVLFETKLTNLKEEISLLKENLSEFIPVDFLEWHISAKERLAWAELQVNNLLNTQTIVISTDGSNSKQSIMIKQLYDYEAARAWYLIAQDFYTFTKQSKKRIKPEKLFEEAINEMISKVELGANKLGENAGEDVLRRLNASKEELKNGWNLAAFYDSATALALINSKIVVENKDLNQLYELLKSKIETLDLRLTGSYHSFIWANLYLDHAKYYLSEADFYYSQNQGAATIDSLKNGIGLAFLAEALFFAAEDVFSYYDEVDESKFFSDKPRIETKVVEVEKQVLDLKLLLALLVPLTVILAVVLFLLVRVIYQPSPEAYSVKDEAARIKRLQKEVDGLFLQGSISEEKYSELNSTYKQQLRQLDELKKETSGHLLDLDRFKAELFAYERRQRDLRKHLADGLISRQQFDLISKEYEDEVNELNKEIKEENLEMIVEKERLMKLKEKAEDSFSGVLPDALRRAKVQARKKEKTKKKEKLTDEIKKQIIPNPSVKPDDEAIA